MAWAASIVAGGSIIGGLLSSSASSSAAKAQSQAAANATDAQLLAADKAAGATIGAAHIGAGATVAAANAAANATRDAAKIAADVQWKMYEQSRQDQLPWLKAGKKALGELEKKVYAGPGEFTESPGYQFRLDQGNKNILSNQAATGNLASGRTLKALQEYGQDYASNEYQNFLNQYYQSLAPLQSLSGLGQSTATTMGGQAISTGQGIASTYNNMGSSLAGIYSSQGSALAGIYGGMGSNLASIYQGQGNAIAQGYMNQGNIASANSINQANIWNNTLSGITSAAGYFLGNQNPQFGSPAWYTPSSANTMPGSSMQYIT